MACEPARIATPSVRARGLAVVSSRAGFAVPGASESLFTPASVTPRPDVTAPGKTLPPSLDRCQDATETQKWGDHLSFRATPLLARRISRQTLELR